MVLTNDADLLLDILTGQGAGRGLLELRHRVPTGMTSRFYPAHTPQQLAADAVQLAEHADVYVGCGLRRRRRGDRDAVGELWTLWADCDSPAATDAALNFDPGPTLVLGSGSPGAAHAYWALERPIDAGTAEHANRRLATAIGADTASTDAARILRPPGTRNHKHRPAREVTVIAHHPHALALRDIVGVLPARATALSPAADRRQRLDDPLLEVPPRRYVPMLVGAALGRDHKVACPLHADTTPSLHAYRQPDRGWYCFGCRRGGTIYDLAAALWGLGTRGSDFRLLRRRLAHHFLSARAGGGRRPHTPRRDARRS